MTAVLSFIFRLAAGLIGFIVVLSLLALALLTTVVLVVWSLLRGRRPTIDVSRFQQATRGSTRHASTRNAGDVVDVEVREVPDAHQRLADSSSRISP